MSLTKGKVNVLYLQGPFVNYDQVYIKPVTDFYLYLMKSC